ncbi:MAG: DNA/RNA non-specific endonuclease [Senegalimassilia anaerobia]|uniref:DNA/RNA non-specific endonuclease n=1 Tax=Senegalimassilia anaerobia TaxID=1473216 RepID=UPI002E775D46|nr:DNA/RNA non-specific endonuclease [Senegalimassilia anaerobia]MEE0303506.1 DNA/RNA non-specific endonuclease [Senegalimassilia anaerobia]
MKDTRTLPLPQRIAAALAALALAFSFALPATGCSISISDSPTGTGSSISSSDGSAGTYGDSSATSSDDARFAQATIADIPAYTGALCIDINHGMPGFTAQDEARGTFMQFSDLDFEGRCGTAFARIGPDTVSNEKRGDISQVHPSGWVQRKYSFVDDGMLYNRSHLIAHQLCGENANEKNLITGTRTFNAVGMLYYEELVGDYVRSTGNHVLYRVTPLFAANDLVARGVQMEAKSVEDNGEAVQFNVFVYNVEPGVAIDYVTGESWESSETPQVTSKGSATITTAAAARADEAAAGSANGSKADGESGSGSGDDGAGSESNTSDADGAGSNKASSQGASEQQDYILNVKNKKFHKPDCSAASDISNANKQDFTGTRDQLIARGYSPCGICKP